VDAEGKLHVSGNKDGIATLRADIKVHKVRLVAILQAVPASLPPVVSTPVKHTRRRALASAPPPHTSPLTDATHAFLYSVLKDGRVERGTFVSMDLKTEPEAYTFLRGRFPLLTVQWARVVTHRVCAGCKHFTGGALCNADQPPDYAAIVGSCGRYERAGEL
jgi:hypothetical protein